MVVIKKMKILSLVFLLCASAQAEVEQVDNGYTVLDAISTGFKGCPEWCKMMAQENGWNELQCLTDTSAQGYCGVPPGSTAQQQTPSSVPLPAPYSETCQARYQNLVQKCESAKTAAGNPCDSNQNSQVASVTSGAGNMSGTGSIQDACKQSNNLSTSAISALTNFKQNCSAAINTCKSSCAELTAWVNSDHACFNGTMDRSDYQSRANSVVQGCSAHQAKIDSADRAIASYNNQATTSEQCAQQTAGENGENSEQSAEKKEVKGDSNSGLEQLAGLASGLAGNSAAETSASATPTFCQQNPTAIGCSSASTTVNCLDPSQATTNKVCVCATNPMNPMCSSGQASQANFASTGQRIDSSSSRVPTSADAGGYDPTSGLPTMMQGPSGSGGGGGEGLDGRQGSGNPVGSSNVGNGGGNFKAATPPSYGDDNSARPGGGGYGGGGRGFGRGGGSNAVRAFQAQRNNAEGANSNSQSGTPDLRRFLPGGIADPKSHGLAGAAGPDGITGPHSNNFKKMQNRYYNLYPTLLP